MNTRRIIGITALGAATVSMTFVPGAGAQEPALSYAAQGTGEALRLSAFGEELTVGRTAAELDSSLVATAKGTGLATPAFEEGVSTAEVTGEGTDGSEEETCAGELPEELPGLTLAAACSSSLARVVDGAPHAQATGGVSDIAVNPVEPLLDTPLTEVVEPTEEAVDQLVDGLRPVTSGVDEATDLGIENTLDDLFHAFFEGADLVSISLGNATTQSTVGPDALSAACTASGGRVDVLDPPEGVEGEPVLSLIVGSADTTVDVDTTTAEATATVDPAIVNVVVPSMGIDEPVGPGETMEIPLPEPLGTSTIAVADGRTGENENGQTFAIADAVFLDLLNGEAMNGGVELSLANCTSLAGAAIQQTTTTTTTTTEPQPSLPRTGGTGPDTLALAATVGLAGLGLSLLRRSAGSAS